MKLSRKFLLDYIDIPNEITTNSLAEEMTHVGNEYDSCDKLIPATNLVIGEILECTDHPDSDHLHLCKVDIGTEILDIVCGAPNARKGIKVIVAKVGANLPGGEIKAGKIRGCVSNGMLCSKAELGLDNKFLEEKDKAGIHELGNDAIIGEDPIKYMGLDDEVIDFELTSNRGDLLSILGMAYEIGAIYNTKVKDIDLSYKETGNIDFNLGIETDNCTLFLAKEIKNVTIKESPDFIKNRLIASGIRPINNVVDISNYVMLETGQPLHFYDLDRLGRKIIVRMAEDKEELTTLDNEKRILSTDDIVITDGTKAVGLAGVMGGLSTEIEEDTKNILIEAAIFNSTKIRKTAKKILRSEASNRFEKGIDPKRTYMAIERCCNLLSKYADATIIGGMEKIDNTNLTDTEISVSLDKINKVLGVNIAKEEVIDILTRLDFKVSENNNIFTVIVPTRRLDISIKEDIIEEVGRYYGMEKIQGSKLILPVKEGKLDKRRRVIKNKMISLGLNEALSYALIPENEVHKYTSEEFTHINLADPMSEDRKTLRYSLLYSLEQIYNYNKARNFKDTCIFEIGKGFYKENDIQDVPGFLLATNKYAGYSYDMDLSIAKEEQKNYTKIYLPSYEYEIVKGRAISSSGECLVNVNSGLEIGNTINNSLIVGYYKKCETNGSFDKDLMYDNIVIVSSGDFYNNNISGFSFTLDEAGFEYFENQGIDVLSLRDYQIKAQQEYNFGNNIGVLSFALILFIASTLLTYLSNRGKIINEIGTLGVYRSIGKSRKSLIYQKMGYNFILTTTSTLIGYSISWIIHYISRSFLSEIMYQADISPLILILGLIILYVVGVFIGILPTLTLVKKTPAEINSKYDI